MSGPGSSSAAHTNLPVFLAAAGRHEEAAAAHVRTEEIFPDRLYWREFGRSTVAGFAGDLEVMHDEGRALAQIPRVPGVWRGVGLSLQASADAARGRMDEADRHLDEAIQAARRDGRWEDLLANAGTRARIGHAVGRTAVAAEPMEALLESGALDSLPPLARPYGVVAEDLGRVGLHDEAAEVLDAWGEAGLVTSTGAAMDESRRFVEALALSDEDPAAALAALDALRRDIGCEACFRPERAELARAAGQTGTAIGVYEELATGTGTTEFFLLPVLRPVAHETLGALYEEGGDTTQALEHYRRFTELWADADPELQPRVEAARARIADLGG